METKVLYSKLLVDSLALQVADAVEKLGKKPILAVILVGNNPESTIYVKRKQKLASKLGCECNIYTFEPNIDQLELVEFVEKLNVNDNINGIIVQLPLPEHLNASKLLNIVEISKDVDGLTDGNHKLLLSNNSKGLRPATPTGIMRLLEWANTPLNGEKVAVIGRSRLVGEPMGIMLGQKGAAVEQFSLERPIEPLLTKDCSVIISAAGQADLIRPEMVESGTVVIDVGINRNDAGEMVGDVAASEIMGIAKILTPVPGGVGSMTVISLMTNLVEATYLQAGLKRPVWEILELEKAVG